MANTFFLAPTANYVTKTLSGGIDDSVTTITLNNTTNLQAPGYIVINRTNSSGVATPDNREVVSYTGISGSDLTGCTRAADGSTARTHTDGSLVETVPTIGMWNSLSTIVATAMTSDGYLKAINSPVSVARMQITQEAVVSIASIAQLHVPLMYATNATITSTANIGKIALNSIASAASGEFQVLNQSGHIDIRPGASKLVKIAILEQDDTTDNYRNSAVILTGWGYGVVSGTPSFVEDTVTFGITYATIPIVVCSAAGAGTTLGSETAYAEVFSNTYSQSTTSFIVHLQRYSGNMANGQNVRYNWTAIGSL